MQKIQISLSTDTTWHLTNLGNLEFLTLISMPPKDFTIKEIRKVPYVEINRQMLWNKGTDEEGPKPTLQYLSVPVRKQNKGIGKILFGITLGYMRHSNLDYLVFDNFDKGFWDSVKKRYPHNVEFPKPYKKRLGIVVLPGANIENVL